MVLCRMNILGLCTVVCLMTIYGVDVCDAECSEYIVVFEETTCHHNKSYKLKPLTIEQIERNNLTYPCNSTDPGKKNCLIEFDCLGKSFQHECQKHVIEKNITSHSFIADNHTVTSVEITTEAGGLPSTAANNHTVTSVETTTEAGGLPSTAANNHTVTSVETTTEAGGLPSTAANNHTVTSVENTTEADGLPSTAAANHTVTSVETTTEAGGLPSTAANNHTVTSVETTTEAGGLPSTAAANHTVTSVKTTTEAGGLPSTAAANYTVTSVETTTEAGGLPSTAAANHTVTSVETTTEAGGLPSTAAANHTVSSVETTTEAGGLPSTAANNHTVTSVETTTEAGGLPSTAAANHTVTSVETTTKAGGLPSTTANNHTVTPVETTTEAGGLPSTAAANHTVTSVETTTEAGGLPSTAANNHTVTSVETTTEAGGLPSTAAANHTVSSVETTTEAGGLPSTAAANHTVTSVETTTEAGGLPSTAAANHTVTSVETTTEAGGLPSTAANNHTVTPVETTTEAGGLPSTAANNHTVTSVETTTEAGGLPSTAAANHTVTSVETTTEAGGLPSTAANNHTVTSVETTTEAGGLPSTAANNHTVTSVETTTEAGGLPSSAAINHTVTPVETTTEAGGVINNNITVEQEIHRKMHAVLNPTTYDINVIYIQNRLERTNETSKPRNQVFQCKYAEIVCANDNLSDFKNDINEAHHYEPPKTLQIEISQDKTSTVQPLFTGYFPESSNDSTTNYNHHFSGVMTTSCSIQKDGNCKENIDSLKYINIYLEANYVENNTVTKYPNCTKDSLTPKNELIVKCEDISFSKHNPHILQGPPTPPQKQKFWNCQITEFKNTSPSKEPRSENNKIHFINCSNETKMINHKNKSEKINIVPISDINNLTGMKINMTEISSGKEVAKINIITILITENPNNCSHNSILNINEGKIIDLGIYNNKEKNLQNNNVDIILSNCINDHSSIINNKQSPLKTELIIILKNESFNTSNLKQFNGTLKDESVKQRILLRCDHTILDLNSNTTSNTTELQCESIDLDLHNITGIEITPSSQTKQKLAIWNCIVLEEQQKNKLDFGNCSNDVNINDSKNKSRDDNVTAIFDKKTGIPSGKHEQDKDYLSQPKHMIKIVITEIGHNCSNNSFLSIDGGKIIDLGEHNNKHEILENNNVELKLSDCINGKSSNINETQADLKDLTIILKTESLNASDLQQFNGTPKERSVKQRILLRCEHPNRDYRVNTTSNMTVLQCESINLDSYNITGIEIITNLTQSSHVNNTQVILKNDEEIDNNINANHNFNHTVGKNDSTVNNNINENKTKEVQKNIPESNKNNKTKDENKEIRKNISDRKEYIKNQNINRAKDIPDGIGQNSLALESGETEKILLVALLSIAGGSILIVIVLRICTRKKEYNPAPTREPRDEEETAF